MMQKEGQSTNVRRRFDVLFGCNFQSAFECKLNLARGFSTLNDQLSSYHS